MKQFFYIIAIVAFVGCSIQRKTSGSDSISLTANPIKTTFFSNMSETERNEWLTVNAKELTLKYYPQYYRDVEPVIWQDTVVYSDENKRPRFVVIIPIENQTGRSTYSYGVNGKTINKDIFFVRVAFWVDTGEVHHIQNAANMGICFKCH